MHYTEFENIITSARMGRYRTACANDTRKAMTLYRKNLKLSQELFTIVSCFEIALRNTIDRHYTSLLGNDWLRNAIVSGGIFDTPQCRFTKRNINDAISQLGNYYTHYKLVAELGFGFWRYMFANNQFRAGSQSLLRVFPSRPTSSRSIQYNHSYIFVELQKINDIRNRVAHHEPICFIPGSPIKNTNYARQHYNLILQLFQWMNIDESSFLYGLDHIDEVCTEIDRL